MMKGSGYETQANESFAKSQCRGQGDQETAFESDAEEIWWNC